MIAPAAPDMIPQISPITSLHMFVTISALCNKKSPCFAPFIRLELIATNGVGLAVAIATPIVSKNTPKKINIIKC